VLSVHERIDTGEMSYTQDAAEVEDRK
jgi:hypothetical protein